MTTTAAATLDRPTTARPRTAVRAFCRKTLPIAELAWQNDQQGVALAVDFSANPTVLAHLGKLVQGFASQDETTPLPAPRQGHTTLDFEALVISPIRINPSWAKLRCGFAAAPASASPDAWGALKPLQLDLLLRLPDDLTILHAIALRQRLTIVQHVSQLSLVATITGMDKAVVMQPIVTFDFPMTDMMRQLLAIYGVTVPAPAAASQQ